MKKVTIVFPIGGEGERFGDQFKPFIEFDNKKFIEHALLPFLKWNHWIKEFRFLSRKDHEEKYNVTAWIQEIILANEVKPDVKIRLLDRTPSVCDAIVKGCDGITGPVIFCDCDHSINVDPLFDYILAQKYHDVIPDCIIPIWSLIGEEVKNWAIAAVDDWNKKVTSIAEKKYPEGKGAFYGVIGCYYFKKYVKEFFRQNKNISGAIDDYIDEEKKVGAVEIQEAKFFGDPDRLRATKNDYAGTIFIDLDGTIVIHQDVPDDNIEILPGVKEKMQKWYDQGYYIIITTGRDNKGTSIHNILSINGIPFHYILNNLPSGPRYLINDRKPWDMLSPMAESFDIERDQGISDINISKEDCTIYERLSGDSFSFAQTFVIGIKGNDKKNVRKIVKKNNLVAIKKLKAQYERMMDWSLFDHTLVPELIDFSENSAECYYDIEYLPGHKPLHYFANQAPNNALPALFERLEMVYTTSIIDNPDPLRWLQDHYKEKVKPKLIKYRETLDTQPYTELIETLLRQDTCSRFLPKKLCTIHGDLTFSNILYNFFDNDIKFIDLEDTKLLDAPELDLGKLFQSTDSGYEYWSKHPDPNLPHFVSSNKILESNNMFIIDHWMKIFPGTINCYSKAYLYLSFHLIRMLPYRMEVNKNQAEYALNEAIKYLKKAIKT